MAVAAVVSSDGGRDGGGGGGGGGVAFGRVNGGSNLTGCSEPCPRGMFKVMSCTDSENKLCASECRLACSRSLLQSSRVPACVPPFL